MRILSITIVLAALALAGCQREGPAEKAGRKIDNAADKTARSVEKAGDNVRDAVNGKK
jgi:predicted small lipoprotein YifL